MAIQISKILRNKQALILNLDQGLEKGPKQFTKQSIDPENLLRLALEAQYTGVVLTPGVAEKYYHHAYKDIPLIIKLNGKTSLGHLNPDSRQFASVEHAIRLGADAVAYTIYDGSSVEPHQFKEFGAIVEEAHSYGLPVIAYMSPQEHAQDTDTLAYSARVALELGADFVKLRYNEDHEGFKWVCQAAGRTKVLTAEPSNTDAHHVLEHAYQLKQAGTSGVVLGAALYHHEDPYKLARALNAVLFHDKKPADVHHFLT